jgi:hypothetical protein
VSKSFQFLLVLISLTTISSAQTITETFGSGANQFTIDFVEIGNPGNAAAVGIYQDGRSTPYTSGSVAYYYNLGKYEISRDQISKANASASLGITLSSMIGVVGATQADRPATGISWYEAARFVNYLNTSKGYQAAYNFGVSGDFQTWGTGQYIGNNQFRHKDAYFFLPSLDEWYKGAYGNISGGWASYATLSGALPEKVTGGTNQDSAVYGLAPGSSGPAAVNNAGGLNSFGTMGQGGNVAEWTETAFDLSNDSVTESRELRGGYWISGNQDLNSSVHWNYGESPIVENDVVGFRVASLPEPSSLSLLLAGGAVLMAGRRWWCN